MIMAKRGTEWRLQKRGEVVVCDSAGQYGLLGRMLIKMLGRDDVTAITSETGLDVRLLLQSIPRSFGQATSDGKLTFDQAIRKAKLAGKPVGRSMGTLARWLTQFVSFLRFLKGSGCTGLIDLDAVGEIKPKDNRAPNSKREALSTVDYKSLFAHETWTGETIIHDSLYWVSILARYIMARLNEICDLRLIDVDFGSDIPCLVFVLNENRDTKSMERRVPIPPQALRLGFRAYYKRVKALGFDMLFPDLPARGRRTDCGELFNKKFLPVLERQVPGARESLATLRASRKKGNTDLHNAGVPDSLCCQILGHAQEGVNARVYLDALHDQGKLDAIQMIEIVTADILACPIRLSSLVNGSTESVRPGRVRKVRPGAPAMADVAALKIGDRRPRASG